MNYNTVHKYAMVIGITIDILAEFIQLRTRFFAFLLYFLVCLRLSQNNKIINCYTDNILRIKTFTFIIWPTSNWLQHI